MYLSEVTLKNFRSYKDAHFSFDKSLTLITGKNGTGKTNLLEAVYVLLQGTSFRVGDRNMIRDGDIDWWRLDGLINHEPRQVRYQVNHHPPKQIIERQTTKRFMYTDRLPVVLFEPTDLQLIHGSPSRRRDSLDVMLVALSSSYKTTLGRYERALTQRNNALKKSSVNLEDQLFSWDILLSEYGVEISRARAQLITQLNERLAGFYGEIAGESVELSVRYSSNAGSDTDVTQYISHLHAKRQLDMLRGTTSYGPHRDDFSFELRSNDARLTASRGEVRTILLSLKLAYAALMEKTYEQKPLILLDDVLSELDTVRQTNLLSCFGDHQVIMTDTKSISGIKKSIKL